MDLARVAAVASVLGLDAPAFPVITVGGTNGKGSIVAHLEALFRTRGAATGLFSSPHLIRYNERIRIDGREVGDAELIGAFERIEAARGSTTLTFFEYNTLAALLVFKERAVDIAILEVGLGGRLDATNVLDADVAVLASVGFDHTDFLGDTLELIGAEKAGIFRPGRPAVLGTPQMPASVFAAIAARGTRPLVAERDFHWRVGAGGVWEYEGLGLELRALPPSALAGAIQYRNAATAIAAYTALGLGAPARPTARALATRLGPLDERTVTAALRSVQLAGRFQVIEGEVEWILDIAHNEPAAHVLAAQLRERPLPPLREGAPRGARTFGVIGVLKDKDARAIASSLVPLIDQWIVCALPGPRGSSAGELAERLGVPRERVTLAPSVSAGCDLAAAAARPGDRVVVFGSLYTVGPALEWLQIYS